MAKKHKGGAAPQGTRGRNWVIVDARMRRAPAFSRSKERGGSRNETRDAVAEARRDRD